MTRISDGAPDPVTDVVRAADLRARTPQSAIPTQGGPPLLPPPRSGPPPMGPMIGPPSGPARRSPLLTPQGRPTPQHPSGEQPPLDDEVSVPLKVRLAAQWRRAREVAKTPSGRWSLIGVAAVLQVFLLFSTVMWWVSSPATVSVSSSLTWTGIVHDVGPSGVYLRSAAQVDPTTARDTAALGSRLAVQCGQTGDVVGNGSVHTATWLKTTDGLFVSMLYVRIPDRQSIPACAGSTGDAPLLALADPTDPDLPPPPGASLAGSEGEGSGSPFIQHGGDNNEPRVVAGNRRAAAAALPGAPVAPQAEVPKPPVATPPTIGTGSATPTTTSEETGRNSPVPTTTAPSAPPPPVG